MYLGNRFSELLEITLVELVTYEMALVSNILVSNILEYIRIRGRLPVQKHTVCTCTLIKPYAT